MPTLVKIPRTMTLKDVDDEEALREALESVRVELQRLQVENAALSKRLADGGL